MSKKRTLHNFFGAASTTPVKKPRVDQPVSTEAAGQNGHDIQQEDSTPSAPPSIHPTYPFPIASLSESLASTLSFSPYDEGTTITDAPDLDLLYHHPYIPPQGASAFFKHLRTSLPFYRVIYTIKRGPTETVINTPRYTTVFGIDDTAIFSSPTDTATGATSILDAKTKKPLPPKTYSCQPRPIPECLDVLRRLTEASTGEKFNFCLVNYYATGADSISYHSDDERFLGPLPSIASFSLGGTRDFLLRHKPPPTTATPSPENDAIQVAHAKPRKYELSSGDMILMRGKTQGCWLHSIPQRTGKAAEKQGGRINITFRRAMVRGGTENYYKYNVGTGPVYVWDDIGQEMVLWKREEGDVASTNGNGVKKEEGDAAGPKEEEVKKEEMSAQAEQ